MAEKQAAIDRIWATLEPDLDAYSSLIERLLGYLLPGELEEVADSLEIAELAKPEDEEVQPMPTEPAPDSVPIRPRKLSHEPEAYRQGVNGTGDLAYTWKDKPHRLVYDLVAEVVRLRQAIVQVDLTLRVPAAEYVPAISDAFTIIDQLELPEIKKP
jgi:hypothetical protein